jgi:hypothetical protein
MFTLFEPSKENRRSFLEASSPPSKGLTLLTIECWYQDATRRPNAVEDRHTGRVASLWYAAPHVLSSQGTSLTLVPMRSGLRIIHMYMHVMLNLNIPFCRLQHPSRFASAPFTASCVGCRLLCSALSFIWSFPHDIRT